MKLEDYLQEKYGYNPNVKDALQTYIDQWNSWYTGNVKSFHNYFWMTSIINLDLTN